MSEDDTIPMNLEDALKALWLRDKRTIEMLSELFRRCYILELEVDGLLAELHALRLRVKELDEKEKGPDRTRPNF
jgi:hypothetical protein